jgi:hypothetical protein
MTRYDVLGGLRPILDALATLDIPHFLSGPIATGIHGIGRIPLDAEIVAALSDDQARSLDAALAPDYVRTGPAVLLRRDMQMPITLRRARPSARTEAAFARVWMVVLDPVDGYTAPVVSPEDAILDLLPAVAVLSTPGSQLWYDVQAVLKVQGDRLDLEYLRSAAESAGLGAALRTLIDQRDTVPLSWDCPLDAEARWLAHVRRLTPTERFTLDRYDMAEARMVFEGVYG